MSGHIAAVDGDAAAPAATDRAAGCLGDDRAAVDGDGGVAAGGVRLGDHAGAGTWGRDVVSAYHGALGRVGFVLNDPVFNNERRVSVDDGAFARIVRLACRRRCIQS